MKKMKKKEKKKKQPRDGERRADLLGWQWPERIEMREAGPASGR